MISVIVPVYNVEPYLRKCLDSIVNQTYRGLEILVIDDGSTDGFGKICDEYTGKDERVKVFHTENRGLSAARNLGLDEAQGEWIGFVDSDDWIEPDMYEVLLNRALETGADIVECGVFKEYPDRTIDWTKPQKCLSAMEAVRALLQRDLRNAVWNKLWKRTCFNSVRFPEDRVFEDVAVTYQVFSRIDRICTVCMSKYHYQQRIGSLSEEKDEKSLVGYWQSHRERYEFLQGIGDDQLLSQELVFCGFGAARIWALYCDFDRCGIEPITDTVKEIHVFTKRYIPIFGKNGWGLRLRIGVFFPHFLNGLSFRSAWLMNRLYRSVVGLMNGGVYAA